MLNQANYRAKNATFLLAAFLATLFFWLNIHHHSEQWPWLYTHLRLAENLLNGGGYAYAAGESAAAYPVWGYPFLAALMKLLGGYDLILLLQYLLLLLSIGLVYRYFDVDCRNFWHRLIFISAIVFYAMALSVKWPDAILTFCLLLFAVLYGRQKYFQAGLALVLGYNFRTEALLFLLLYLAVLVIGRKKIAAASLLLLLALPWGAFQYYHHRQVILTSSNSGGVLYISLGQLPGNAWNREHDDREAYEYSQAHGVNDPWGLEGNKLLTGQFLADVTGEPLEFAKKLAYNAFAVVKGGLYITEVETFAYRGRYEERLEESAFYRANLKRLFQDAVKGKPEALLLLFRGVIGIYAKLFFAFLLLYTVFRIASGKARFDLSAALIALQILLCIFIQYLPRHLSHVVILFLFVLYRANPARPVQRASSSST
jgi:hypothetical protein